MKKLIVTTLLALTAGFSLATVAQAATAEQKAEMKQKWASMTPEQKAAAKEKANAKWDSMSPEEQAAAKQKFAAKHPRAAAKAAEKQKAAAATQ